MADDNAIVEAVVRVAEAISVFDYTEQLLVLSMAWMSIASQERSAALALPGGFPEAKQRQAEQLERIAALVRLDEPDLEAERLWQEGDFEGFTRHIRGLLDANGDDEKGGR